MRLFITGGTGYLGKHLIQHFYDKADITIFSRDEAKQFFIKQKYPNINCILGDIRNYDGLLRAMKRTWPEYAIFAASMKHIDACKYNYEEANEVIVKGAFNSRNAAEECGVTSSCFISSDKSRAATTIYGAMKYVAGEAFITEPRDMNVSTLVYGNVMNSTGSIIPKIWESMANGQRLYLYHRDMTRFLYDIKDAVSLIEYSLFKNTHNGSTIVPKLKSFKVMDLFELYAEKFGLMWAHGKPRSGEKIHEVLISSEEWSRIYEDTYEQLYFIHDKFQSSSNHSLEDYSSENHCITKQKLKEYLDNKGWFK